MPLLDEYHPQDLLALGLTLAGTACVNGCGPECSWGWQSPRSNLRCWYSLPSSWSLPEGLVGGCWPRLLGQFW